MNTVSIIDNNNIFIDINVNAIVIVIILSTKFAITLYTVIIYEVIIVVIASF